MAIWNTFRKNSFKFGYEGHLVLTVYLKKYLMGKGAGFEPTTFGL